VGLASISIYLRIAQNWFYFWPLSLHTTNKMWSHISTRFFPLCCTSSWVTFSFWGDLLHLWQPFDLAWTHLFHCSHGGEHIVCNNAGWDASLFISRDTKFNVLHEQTYVLPPFSLQSSCWEVDIILSIDCLCTLVNVFITNLIWVDLISQVVLFCGMAVTMVVQAKDGLYHTTNIRYTHFFSLP
jgi:hypothetical protein